MKNSLILIILGFFTVVPVFSQSNKALRQQQEYSTSYEKSNLSEKVLPV
jgi:hypothetical protein